MSGEPCWLQQLQCLSCHWHALSDTSIMLVSFAPHTFMYGPTPRVRYTAANIDKDFFSLGHPLAKIQEQAVRSYGSVCGFFSLLLLRIYVRESSTSDKEHHTLPNVVFFFSHGSRDGKPARQET